VSKDGEGHREAVDLDRQVVVLKDVAAQTLRASGNGEPCRRPRDPRQEEYVMKLLYARGQMPTCKRELALFFFFVGWFSLVYYCFMYFHLIRD
jgi:hypothetical protein